MLIERIWSGNSFRNFHYLIACEKSGEALAVDPLEWRLCLDLARERGWQITQILNTHEHPDHTGGNAGLVKATGARVLAHAGAATRIGGVDRGLAANDKVRVGSLELRCLDTPGHTMSHICLLAEGDPPGLFCGDTLFNAGAGNCHNGGDPNALYETFARQLESLPDDTRVYSGHEYLGRNLEFTLDREPGNSNAQDWRVQIEGRTPAAMPLTTLADERRINVFFRLRNPEIIAELRRSVPGLPAQPAPRDVFLALRALRNRW